MSLNILRRNFALINIYDKCLSNIKPPNILCVLMLSISIIFYLVFTFGNLIKLSQNMIKISNSYQNYCYTKNIYLYMKMLL